MKLWLTLLLFLLLPFALISQKQFSSVELGKYFAEKVTVIPDNKGSICVYSRDYSNHNFTIIDSGGKFVRTRTFKRSSKIQDKYPFAGATITKNEFILFFSDFENTNKYYNVFTISKNDTLDFYQENIPLPVSENEEILKSYTDNGSLHFITLDKNDEIHLIKFKEFLNQKDVETKSVLISKDLYQTLSKNKFSIIKNTQNYTLPLVAVDEKMYVSDLSKVVFTEGNKRSRENKMYTTDIYYFDFNTGSYYHKPIQTRLNGSSFDQSVNSFYYKDKLFLISLSRELLGLNVLDVESGIIVKQYEYGREDEISIISDKVVSKRSFMYGGTALSTKEKIIAQNDIILGNLNIGKPGLSIKPFGGDTLQILMGAVEFDRTHVPVPTTAIGATRNLIVPLKNKDVAGVCWFNTFLKDNSYEIVSHLKSEPEFYKVDQFKAALKEQDIRVHLSSVFRYNGKLYFGYIPIDKTTFIIVEII